MSDVTTKTSNRRMWLYWTPLVLLIAVLIILLAVARKGAKPFPEETYRLKWLANAGFVGDLYADSYGLFLEEKLRVTVRPGGPEHDAIRELQTGAAQFGVASADQVIRARSEGADVVVIAQIYQKNPVRWIYRVAGTPIDKPADLVGKKVGITIGDNDETIMRALLAQHGIAETNLTLTGVRYDFSPFTKGQLELFPVYWNTQGVELEEHLKANREKADFFDPDKHGIHFVANAIVTTTRMVTDEKAMVERFLSAALKGWRESLDPKNEDMAIRAVLRYERPTGGMSEAKMKEIVALQLQRTRDVVLPSVKSKPLGTIDLDGWKQTEDIMLKRGLIKKPVSIENNLKPDFVNAATTKH